MVECEIIVVVREESEGSVESWGRRGSRSFSLWYGRGTDGAVDGLASCGMGKLLREII